VDDAQLASALFSSCWCTDRLLQASLIANSRLARDSSLGSRLAERFVGIEIAGGVFRLRVARVEQRQRVQDKVGSDKVRKMLHDRLVLDNASAKHGRITLIHFTNRRLVSGVLRNIRIVIFHEDRTIRPAQAWCNHGRA